MTKRSLKGHVIRVIVLFAMWTAWYIVYAYLNAKGAKTGISWQAPGIFVPIAVYPYIFGSLLLIFLPLFWNWGYDRFIRLVVGYVLVIVISSLVYWLYPVYMKRITYDGPGLPRLLMRMVTAADDPANCFPSSHCMFATLGFIYVWASGANKWVTIFSAVVAIMVCISTVLVGQHYWVDIPGGIAAAVISYVLSRVLIQAKREG